MLMSEHKLKPSELNLEIPIEWDEVPIGDVFAERREANRPDLELLAITSSRGVVKRDELEKRDTSNPDKAKYLRIAPNDIGYNTMRMWQGVSGVSPYEGIISPAYTVCIPNQKIDTRFAAYLFKFPPMVQVFRRFSQGLVDDTLSLKFDTFAKIKMPLPPLLEQQRISRALQRLDVTLEVARELELQARRLREIAMQTFLETQEMNFVRIGSIARVAQGYTFKPRHQGNSTGQYLYAKVSDMTRNGNERTILDAANWVNEDVLEEMKYTPFPKNTIIFPRVGAALRTNKKRILGQDSLIDDNLIAIIVENLDLCDSFYFLEWLETIDLAKFANDGPLPSITRSTIQNSLIPIPPLPEQQRIVTILETFDARLTTAKDYISQLETLKQKLLQALLTGQVRVPAQAEV
jgi:type I restriction enzyme, S subunit